MDLEGPGPELDDGVVRLRGWQRRDLACVQAASEEGHIPEGTTVPVDFTEQAGLAYIERQQRRPQEGAGWALAIADSATGEAVGYAGLMVRPQPGVVGLGYWLIPAARGKGYATRAVRLLSAWALGAGGCARVEAWVEPMNLSSTRVLERCGYQYEGRLRSFLSFGTRRADALVYSRTLTDERAATFEPNALAYDRFRPGYPPETFDELPTGDDATIIEVGCGTGQATADLAQRAGRVIAIEPGPTLATLAREHTAGHPHVEIRQNTFEQAPLGTAVADGLFAGMSWHWVDPTTGARRLVEVLRDGAVAVFAWHRPATEPVGHPRLDRIMAQVIQRIAPHLTEGRTPSEGIADTLDPLHHTAELDYRGHRIIEWTRPLDAATARGLFSTYSPYASLEPEARDELLTVLHDTIATEPSGAIDTAMVTEIHTFQRKPRSVASPP
jgi:[ribosomal protein S5]-alanine N-acetyltransferase